MLKHELKCCQSAMLHLISGPIPRSVPVCGSLHMTKLDLICSIGTVDLHWEFHLEELVRFSPLHLKSKWINQSFFRFLQLPLMFLSYLRAELQVRTHGVHDYLLCDGALIADPEGKADDTTELLWGHNMSRLHYLQHWFPKGLPIAWITELLNARFD